MSKFKEYIKLAGSEKAAPKANRSGTINPNEIIDVTVRIRRKKSIDPKELVKGKVISHKEYNDTYGASADDIKTVQDFARQFNLTTVTTDVGRRSVILKGRLRDFESAFQVSSSAYVDEKGVTFRGRTGNINIPAELKDIVQGVFGLDNRPVAHPMFKVAKTAKGTFKPHDATPGSVTPPGLASDYGFTPGTGAGQCIGIIELGGGFVASDLQNYFTSVGITNPPTVTAQSVDNGANSPSTPDSADGEVMLDIEVAGSVAPGANIVVYFTPNTDQGFLDAITTAVHDETNKPSVISVSWGSAEVNWTPQALDNFNAAFQSASLLGVTICIASGDAGSSDGVQDGCVHVDFPASSPYVLACGGTSCQISDNTITSETVWNDASDSAGGGGVSEYFALPDYQQNANVPASLNAVNSVNSSNSGNFKGRGVPDIAGDADPNTGYQVIVDGQSCVIGGTSAVAPLMAGLIAVSNQVNNARAGFINPLLYAVSGQNYCRAITQGNNITTSTGLGYNAGSGWNACAGWGVMFTVPYANVTPPAAGGNAKPKGGAAAQSKKA